MTMEALSQRVDERLDYCHLLEFGYFLAPDAADPLGVLEAARLVDSLGYELLGVQEVAPRVRERVTERRAFSPVPAISQERGA